jgi:hypothetical protein
VNRSQHRKEQQVKRKPPAQNVRRVRAIDGNSRFAIVNKCGRTVQCESFQEYKLVLLLERDPEVQDYLSQPETLSFHNEHGRVATYTPDFQVWTVSGDISFHEVTLAERRSQKNQQQREAAAQRICVARGWRYVVHTETDLPTGSAFANLQLLFGFRAGCFADAAIMSHLPDVLSGDTPTSLTAVVNHLHTITGREPAQIVPTLLYQLWHGQLQTDWQQMLFQDAAPLAAARIWREG